MRTVVLLALGLTLSSCCMGLPASSPGAPAAPTGAPSVPGLLGLPTATAVPASFGIAECDHYAALACGCSNTLVAGSLCLAATQQFDAWRSTVASSPATIESVRSACVASEAGIRPQCP